MTVITCDLCQTRIPIRAVRVRFVGEQDNAGQHLAATLDVCADCAAKLPGLQSSLSPAQAINLIKTKP